VTEPGDAQVDHGGGEMGQAHPTAAGLVALQGNALKLLISTFGMLRALSGRENAGFSIRAIRVFGMRGPWRNA
jgi:hypothetical protein